MQKLTMPSFIFMEAELAMVLKVVLFRAQNPKIGWRRKSDFLALVTDVDFVFLALRQANKHNIIANAQF